MQNENGFSLIELMAAMVIMLVGLLGLLQAVNVALEHNLKNQMRNEVTRVAQDAMNEMRFKPFSSVKVTTTATVHTKLRNINRDYQVTKSVTDIPTATSTITSRKYQVDVKWLYKNVSTTYSVASVRSNTDDQ